MTESQPGVERVQVAATLRRMREQAGLTRDDAAAVLECTISKIGDLEKGRSAPKPVELAALLDRYGVAGEERDALLESARASRRRRPRGSTATASVPVIRRRIADLQAQATSALYWSSELVPAELQTSAYVEALMRWGTPFTDEQLQARLALREASADVLRRTDREPLQFWAVLGEAVLRSGVGGPKVMAGQIRHLLAWNQAQDNVVVQVLPTSSGAHTFLGMTVTLLRMPAPAGDLLLTDTFRQSGILDREADVAAAAHYLDLLRTQAPGRDESNAILEGVLRDIEGS